MGVAAIMLGKIKFNAVNTESFLVSLFPGPYLHLFIFCRAQSERDSSYAVTDDPSEIRRHYAASAGSTAAQCWEVGLEDLQPFNNPDSALREAIKYLANTEDW